MHLDPVPDDGDSGARNSEGIDLLLKEGVQLRVGLPGFAGPVAGAAEGAGASGVAPPRMPAAKKHNRSRSDDQEVIRMPAPALRLTVPSRYDRAKGKTMAHGARGASS